MTFHFSLFAAVLVLGSAALVSPAAAEMSATLQLAQATRPPERTYMTPQNANEIAVQITDGEFYFYDILHRSYGNYFTAANSGVRVTYDRSTGNVLVINNVTGTQFYNYYFSEAAAGSGTYRPSNVPTTILTPLNANQFRARITEGEFVFDGVLTRTSGNTFVGADRQVRVIYDLSSSRVVVINAITGAEFYNYPFSTVDEGYL
ncbi:MAG: hypothetical protein AAFW95_01825 [Cyanobacteria bacterium J06638_6]